MKTIASIVALVTALAATGASAQTSDYLTLGTIFKRVASNTTPEPTSSTTFVDLASTQIFVPAGVAALITARFSAESNCIQPSDFHATWCEIRILVDRVEASPVENPCGADFAFDSTDLGTATGGDRESHTMDRHPCVRNTLPRLRVVPVVVQWAVTNDGGGTPPVITRASGHRTWIPACPLRRHNQTSGRLSATKFHEGRCA